MSQEELKMLFKLQQKAKEQFGQPVHYVFVSGGEEGYQLVADNWYNANALLESLIVKDDGSIEKTETTVY